MASDVDLGNLMLSHLGDDATVTNLNPPEGSSQAEHVAVFFPIARDSLLEMHNWNFATRRAPLAETDLPEGDINLSVTQFQPGDFVDVIGRSKGKGFQGVMKKHNFHGQGAAHGSKTHRRIGAVGNRSTPGRIWKNQGMPGHMGDRRVTVQNLQVMQVREAEKIILISGAVPGPNGSYVIVRPAIKHPEHLLALHAEHRKHEEEEKAKKPKTLREMAQKK